ncbi:MAG: glycosyltransferase [Pirellulales bacterium]|nr:glycosyltransferase [Pirellulales bacterium]
MNGYLVILLAITGVSAAVSAAVCLYHAALALVACLVPHRRGCVDGHLLRFAIVIPAHNEEHTIRISLDSAMALDYPQDRFEIIVVADNCDDDTATVARNCGAACLVRNDTRRCGKGHALEWALPQILGRDNDVVVVLDADCIIGPQSLRAFDRAFSNGYRVVQATDMVENPDSNALSFMLGLANTLENELFYAPKSMLGMAVFLRGTGMAFHREVLEKWPWRALSNTEDTEYSLELIRNGERIGFTLEAQVRSEFPTQNSQLYSQRKRWIRGNSRLAYRHGLRAAWQGLQQHRWLLLDAGFTMWILSRPIVLGQFILTAGLGLGCFFLIPGPISNFLLVCCGAMLVLYVVYVYLGMARIGMTPRRILLLLKMPFVTVRYLLLAAPALVKTSETPWERTPRV